MTAYMNSQSELEYPCTDHQRINLHNHAPFCLHRMEPISKNAKCSLYQLTIANMQTWVCTSRLWIGKHWEWATTRKHHSSICKAAKIAQDRWSPHSILQSCKIIPCTCKSEKYQNDKHMTIAYNSHSSVTLEMNKPSHFIVCSYALFCTLALQRSPVQFIASSNVHSDIDVGLDNGNMSGRSFNLAMHSTTCHAQMIFELHVRCAYIDSRHTKITSDEAWHAFTFLRNSLANMPNSISIICPFAKWKILQNENSIARETPNDSQDSNIDGVLLRSVWF